MANDGDPKVTDDLAESFNELFTSVSTMVKSELQLLEKMNLRVAEEYNGFGDVASGLRVFVQQLKSKSRNFDDYVKQIDAIEEHVTEFEVVISMLDRYLSLLESKVLSVYQPASISYGPLDFGKPNYEIISYGPLTLIELRPIHDDSSDSLADIDVPAIRVNTDTFRDLTADDLDHIDLKERLKILLRRKFADKLAQEMAQEATEPVAKRMKLGVQSVDEESSVSHNQFSQISATNYCHGLAADSYSLEHDATESRHNVEKKRQTSSPKTILANLNSTKVYVPNASMNSSIQTSILPTSVHVKEELLEDSTGFGNSDWKVSTGFSFKPLNVKNEPEVQYEFNEDEVDHMQLSARMKLLPSGIESHLYNSNTFEYLAKVMPGPANEANLDYEKPIQASGPRKRKKTITDSVETAMEEDAPGLLKVLVDQGVSVDEIKLYSEPESNEALDESLCEDSFSELESVMSKLFPRQPSFIKFAAIGCTSTSKPTYSVACLFSLVEQARYVQYRNWPVEWGWCRDLQSFIFVFERHNRIVLERPEYGYATYFFELVDCLPIDWQIKRLVTAMKLSNCGRVSIIEDKPLLAGKDLTEGEAKVLMEYGWTPNTGLGTMLNYRDRVVHTRRNDTEMSEWRSKIGKYLSDGYNGGSIISSTVLNKDICQDADNSMQIKLEI
ncbi:hypothetical protein ACFE04_007665 [Oxalis oulophora]